MITPVTSGLSRRAFLRGAVATGVLAVPSGLGALLFCEAAGELPPVTSDDSLAKLSTLDPSSGAMSSPLMVLVNEQGDNPSGTYLGQILRAEGLNCFRIARLPDVNSADLARYDIVLLSEGSLSADQAHMLEHYVQQGGCLLTMRPAECLAHVFGVTKMSGSTSDVALLG